MELQVDDHEGRSKTTSHKYEINLSPVLAQMTTL